MSDYLKSINGNECKFYRPLYIHPTSKVSEEFKGTDCGHACTLFTEKSILTEGDNVRVDVVIGSKKCPGCEMFTKDEQASGKPDSCVKTETESGDFAVNQNVNMGIGQYAALVIDGKFTVQIKKEKEGYVIDVLSEDNSKDDDVIETITIWNDELEAEA